MMAISNYAQQAAQAGDAGRDRIARLLAQRQQYMDKGNDEVEARDRQAEMQSKSKWLPLLAAGGALGTMIAPGIGTAIGAGLRGLAGIAGSVASGGEPFAAEHLLSKESLMSLLPLAQSMASAGMFNSASPAASPSSATGVDSALGSRGALIASPIRDVARPSRISSIDAEYLKILRR